MLKFSRKYCVIIVEMMAAAVAGECTRTMPSLRSHVTSTLSSLDILVYALDTQCSIVAKTARLVVMEDSWNRDLSPYKLLSTLESYEERELVAIAYYQVLLKGLDNWIFEEELDKSHHHALHIGVSRLSAEWEAIFSDWGPLFNLGIRREHPFTGRYGPQMLECTVNGEIHSKIWRALAARKLHPFDVIGKLNLVREMTTLDRYSDVVLPAVNRQLRPIKQTLHSFFQDPQRPTSGIIFQAIFNFPFVFTYPLLCNTSAADGL